MKWSEFESQNPKDVYATARSLCEEIHGDYMRKGGLKSRFCNYCYKREGWKCFPCNDMKKLSENRYGKPITT
jgi:hypothetical protein